MAEFNFDEDVYKLIIEQLEIAVVTDKYGRYVYVTKSWEDYYGKKLDEVKGMFVRDVLPASKIHEALEAKHSIIGYPVPIVNNKQEKGFCNYIPIIKNGEVVAGFIYVIFKSEKSAVDFSKMLNGMMDELKYYQQELKQLRKAKYSIDEIIGESTAIINLKKQIRRAAKSTSTVLIEGETGCGKLIKQAKKSLKKEIIIDVLEKCCNNKALVSRELGISRTMLYKKMKEYGIH